MTKGQAVDEITERACQYFCGWKATRLGNRNYPGFERFVMECINKAIENEKHIEKVIEDERKRMANH